MFRIGTIGKGFFAIMEYPGRDQETAIGLASLARQDIRQVVSLLQADESQALGLGAEAELVATAGMDFLNFPITDLGLPESVAEFSALSLRLCRQIEAGVNTLIHCRAGIGRSGMLATAILLQRGMSLEQAFEQVTSARGQQVPETAAQGRWLLDNHSAIVATENDAS